MAFEANKYDNLLFEVLQNEGSITSYLDTLFNFLYRRTDFYKIQNDENTSLGFPQGVAERLVRQAFMKYYAQARRDDERQHEIVVPEVTQEEVVSTDKNKGRGQLYRRVQVQSKTSDEDCYNGANLENYKWSQTMEELDIRVKVSPDIDAGRKVNVQVRPDHLVVSIMEQAGATPASSSESGWKVLVDGQFPHRVVAEEAIWSLIPADHVHISLVKREERLWEYLLEGEPKLDMTKLDNSMPMEDMDDESQAVVQELMYNQKQKMLGLPTSKEQKMEKILREAWDVDGSPFKGQPFDMSKINLSNTEGLSRDVPV